MARRIEVIFPNTAKGRRLQVFCQERATEGLHRSISGYLLALALREMERTEGGSNAPTQPDPPTDSGGNLGMMDDMIGDDE